MAASNQPRGDLPGALRLAARPKHSISDREEEKIELKAGVPNALIYVQGCKNCDFFLEKKAIKIFVEGCANCVFNVKNSLFSGTMEFLRCENITLNLKENGQVMTLTTEATNNFQLNASRDDQIDMIYTYHTTNMEIKVEGDNPIRFPVVPTHGPDWQYVVQWLKEPGGTKRLICEKVIREGIYPTTERQLRESLERERQFSERFAEALVGGVKFTGKRRKKE